MNPKGTIYSAKRFIGRRYDEVREGAKNTPDGLLVRSFQDLLAHLKTFNREIINFAGQRIEKLTTPTPTQRCVFELIGVPIPSP